MAFDLKAARDAGYSDAEIADFLASEKNFDAKGAREAGYTDEQIIGQLSMSQQMPAQAKPQGFGAKVEAAIDQVPRQLGLTARYGIEGITGAGGAFVDPVLRLVGAPTLSGSGVALSDMIGLPNPETATERVVGDASRMMVGAGGIVGAANKATKAASGPLTKSVLDAFAKAPAAQISAAGGAGAGAGYARETGGDGRAQLLSAIGTGLLAGAIPGLGMATGRGLLNIVSKPSAANIEVSVSNALRQSGVNYGALPSAVKSALQADAAKIVNAGGTLDAAAIRRLADYRLTGLTPLAGSVTQNPALVTQQGNVSKMQAAMGDTSPNALPSIQNANMHRMVQIMDDLGAAGAPSREAAGQVAQNVIKRKDAAASATENALYAKARGMDGRAAPLDRAWFVTRADDLLVRDGKNAFLPDSIRNRLNEISVGQVKVRGQTHDVPFDVDAINTIKTELASASRSAKDGNEKRAIALVRQALEETPIARTDGLNNAIPEQAMKAFDQARRFARARRNWQESAQGIRDTLDDVPPDRFIEQYVIGGTNKASASDVMKLWGELRKGKADDVARSYVLDYLKRKATRDGAGVATDDATQFSAPALAKALDDIGEAKLKIIFKPDEVRMLQAVRNVAKYETAQTRGSAVNNSNTASATISGLLQWLANSPKVRSLPMGGAMIGDPMKNILVQIQRRPVVDVGSAVGAMPQSYPLLPPPAVPFVLAPGLLSDR